MSTNSSNACPVFHETQQSISAWAAATFGTSGTLTRVVARANEEMAELLRAVTAEAPLAHILDETADVLIVLARVADRLKASFTFESPDARNPMQAFGLIQIASSINFQLAWLINDLAWDRLDIAEGLLGQVWTGLLVLAQAAGSTAQAAVDAKMAKNRKRVWKQDGTGHGYHVRDKTLTP